MAVSTLRELSYERPTNGSLPLSRPVREEDRLPFEPRTLLLGLWRRWPAFLKIGLVSCLLGAGAALLLGSRVWEAETILLFQPARGEMGSLQTQMSMVRIRPNLVGVSKELGLEVTPEELSELVDVRGQANTDLVFIRARAGEAEAAATIANTLRDVFMANQRRIEQAVLGAQIAGLEEHLGLVHEQLDASDRALQEFAVHNGGADIDDQLQRRVERYAQLDQLHEQARIEREIYALQGPGISGALPALRQSAGVHAETGVGEVEALDVRIQGLISAIRGDQDQRAHQAAYAQAEKEYERATDLIAQGLISDSEYQEIRSAYEREKAYMTDTQQTREWKEELAQLMERRMGRLEEARRQAQAEIEALPEVQRHYVTLRREVAFLEAQRQALEEELTGLQRARQAVGSRFSVISPAEPAALPVRSNRRLMAFGIAFFGIVLGGTVLAGREVLNTTIKSVDDLSYRLSLPALGSTTRSQDRKLLLPEKESEDVREAYRAITQRVRRVLPARGARILVTSARMQEGTSLVVTNMAACFGRQDERVLLLDARRPVHRELAGTELLKGHPEVILAAESLWADEENGGESLAEAQGDEIKGLGHYLALQARQPQEVIWPTVLPGVDCIPALDSVTDPEALFSPRMRELLDNLSRQYSVVLLDASPVMCSIDAEALAPWVDGIVMVVRSQMCEAAVLDKAARRLAATGTPIIGAVLNGVDPFFAEK
ncbi:MAG: hypothetical protein AB1505_23190 [Candidatus Latescibacterota bacterium]